MFFLYLRKIMFGKTQLKNYLISNVIFKYYPCLYLFDWKLVKKYRFPYKLVLMLTFVDSCLHCYMQCDM